MVNPLLNHTNSRNRHSAIVLAAGASSRMGQCKAGLPWLAGRSLLAYQVEQFYLAGVTPIVVLSPRNIERYRDCLPKGIVVLNPVPEQGKTSSILTGLLHLGTHFDSLMISAVDQPRSSSIYQSLLQAHVANPDGWMAAPTFQNRMGHPLLFSRKMLPYLGNLREENLGLRNIVGQFAGQIRRVEFNTAEVLLDLNTFDEYQTHYDRLTCSMKFFDKH
jgi:molybdenum cofactor cytidylyltransferase